MSLGHGEVSERHIIGMICGVSAGAAVVLATTMVLAAGLQAWDRDRGACRPLAASAPVRL